MKAASLPAEIEMLLTTAEAATSTIREQLDQVLKENALLTNIIIRQEEQIAALSGSSTIAQTLHDLQAAVSKIQAQPGNENSKNQQLLAQIDHQAKELEQLRTALYREQRKPAPSKPMPKFDIRVTQRDMLGTIISWEIVPKGAA